MKKNKLKKLSIFALTTALTVSCLAGCGKKKEEDTEHDRSGCNDVGCRY